MCSLAKNQEKDHQAYEIGKGKNFLQWKMA